MPWPVYSERFLHHQAVGWWAFTVPEDTRAVLTNLDAISSLTTNAYVSLAVGPILAEYVLFQAPWIAKHAVMRIVAYQGEEITMGISDTGVHATLSGYLFTDESGRTGPPIDVKWRRLSDPPPGLDISTPR